VHQMCLNSMACDGAGAALFAVKAPVPAVPMTALGVLFAVQAGRVRFTFDDEVVIIIMIIILSNNTHTRTKS
jgi:hypothetical protein